MTDAQNAKPDPLQKPGSVRVYTPWFPREADHLSSTLEVVQINGATIKVEVFTKHYEDGKAKLQEDGGKV